MRHNLFLGVAAVALIAPAAVSAQETTSAIRGTVTSGGQPVAGATVVATNVPSGTRSTTTTGTDGNFSLSGLRVGGPFTIEVTSPQGNTTVTDIFTVAQQPFDLPIELADGADAGAGQDIVVTAASIAGAGVTSDGPQTVLTQADISKVASVNRDIRDIQRRDPFATLDLSNSGDRGGAVSFAGVNPRFNRFTINGVQVGDNFGLNQDASPTGRGPVPFDALAQVSVSIAPYDIRQGNFQGGVIDAVLLSGTNTFHGTGFYSQSRDELQGDRIDGTDFPLVNYLSETYGATLSGPLVKDKLFFMVSAERNTDPRPFSTQVSQIPNLTTGQINSIVGTANSVYGYDSGGVLTINERKDEKIVGRLDWNVTDGQRLSVTYINAFDSLVSQNNTSVSNSTPQYGLESNAYTLSNLLRAGIVQLNSDWTDNLSTEGRLLYRYSKRGQEPLRGRGFGQFGVCTDNTSVNLGTGTNNVGTSCGTNARVFFGPDISRQTNELFFDTWAGSLLARYTAGQHEVQLLAEYSENRTFNNFLQNSLGAFYFDSLTDYRNRTANQLTLRVPVNGDPLGAAADFKYGQFTFGFQDDWRITDTFTLTYGIRYDLFGMRGAPTLNPAFLNRYGFPNTQTYKGLDNFQPRIAFNWNGPSSLRLRGGVGVFGGGSPDIYLSNSFSNTVLSSQVVFNRGAGGTCGAGIPVAVCAAALDNVNGQIPAAVSEYVRNTPGAVANTVTGALDPDFHLPASLKATLSADYTLFGFNVGADYLYAKNIHSVIFTDARSVRVGTLPDGRPRYGAATTFTDVNYDVIAGNTSLGRSHVLVARFDKRFDWGLSFGGSYTRQDVKDVSPATSSTINSNYQQQIFGDPNVPAYGRSNDETTWAFKYNLGFDKALFGDYRTVVQLFGETRSGRRYSYTMRDNTALRSSVFGTVLNQSNQLLYVPTGANDPLVSYDSTATRDSLESLIEGTALKNYRGRIAAKNIARSQSFTRIDLHLEQELPTGIDGSRLSVFADIENLPNLLNSKWGGLRQLGFPYSASVVNVACLASATPTGVSGSGVVSNNTAQPCAQYRYSTYTAPNDQALLTERSLYLIRVGARFTF